MAGIRYAGQRKQGLELFVEAHKSHFYMKTSIWLIVFLTCLTLKGQDKYFKLTYSVGELQNASGFSITEVESGNFYAIAGGYYDEYLRTHPFILKVNPKGEIVELNEIDDMIEELSINDIVPLEGGRLFAGGWIETESTGGTYFYEVDANLDIIKQEYIGDSLYTNHCNTVCQTTDGGYLLGGEIQPYDTTVQSPPTHPYLIKLDSSGTKLWERIYYDYAQDHYSWFYDSKATPDGGALLLGTIEANFYYGDILLLKIDSMGEVLQQKIISYGDIEGGGAIVQLSDGGYAIVGAFADNTDFAGVRQGLIIKLDAEWNEQWHTRTYFTGLSANTAVPDSNGSMVVCGSYRDSLQYDLDVELIKLSSTGDLLWRRTYKGVPIDDDDEYAYDMIRAADGSLVLSGRSESSTNGASVYLIKTNCMGLLTEPQADFSYSSQTANNVVSFENLSQYTYPDSIDGGHYLWDFGDGSPVFVADASFEESPLHLYPASGAYEVTLKAVVCSDTSVVRLVVEAGSGFGGTTPVEPVLQTEQGRVEVFPNPAAHTLNIAHQLQNGQAATLTLCDLTGRVCLRRTLTGTGETSTNTDGLRNGLYICTIEIEGANPIREKLLILR